MYQKWPDQIFPIVNFVFSHYGHFGLGRGAGGFGGGVPPPLWFLIILKKPCSGLQVLGSNPTFETAPCATYSPPPLASVLAGEAGKSSAAPASAARKTEMTARAALQGSARGKKTELCRVEYRALSVLTVICCNTQKMRGRFFFCDFSAEFSFADLFLVD